MYLVQGTMYDVIHVSLREIENEIILVLVRCTLLCTRTTIYLYVPCTRYIVLDYVRVYKVYSATTIMYVPCKSRRRVGAGTRVKKGPPACATHTPALINSPHDVPCIHYIVELPCTMYLVLCT